MYLSKGFNKANCGALYGKTVDTQIEGRGSLQTLLIKECDHCGGLYGVEKEWYGAAGDA
jgi:hypothetical protein